MRIQGNIAVIAVGVAVCGGYIAQGQHIEKAAETAKRGIDLEKSAVQSAQKPADASKKKPVDATKKSTDTVKKHSDTSKATVTKPAIDLEEKVVRASAEAFTMHYNAHDSKALAALFSPKAEMIDEYGHALKGREAIEKAFADIFVEHPKASMTVEVGSVRVLTPIMAIEEGMVRSRVSPDRPGDITEYVAIHVKADGKWQLAIVLDGETPASQLTPHDRLEQNLSWLVGEWIDESPDSNVHSVCQWHDNGNFLMQEFQVNVGSDIAMSGTMRIGWDAVAKQFKSWVFDSHGGHSQGTWSWDDERWIVKMQGATASGEVGSSTNYYRPIDGDTIVWGSFDRVIDGERLDDLPEIIIKRRPPLPTE